MVNTIFWIIIAIIVIDFVFTNFLEFLNFKSMKETLPSVLVGIYNQKKYSESQKYDKENTRFSFISGAFSFILILLMLAFGGFGLLDDFVISISSNIYIRAMLFFGILGLLSDILSIPFELYSTFVIEEKFGFNHTTKLTFVVDKLKSWVLMALIGGGLLLFIMWAYNETGSWFWIIVMSGITAFTVIMNMFYTRLIVPLFNKQSPLPEGELKEKLMSFSDKANFKIDNVMVIDGSKRSAKANAYFSGMGSKKRIVLYDTLISDLTEDEVVAVLAHEVGHYKLKHVYTGLALSLLQTGFIIWLLSIFVSRPELSLALGASEPSFYIGLITFGLLLSPISSVTGIFGNVLSRKNEYQADNYAKQMGFGAALVNGLIKLSVKNLSNLTPHWLYVFLLYSHPTLLQRKAKIEES